jgi:hypothetical protein
MPESLPSSYLATTKKRYLRFLDCLNQKSDNSCPFSIGGCERQLERPNAGLLRNLATPIENIGITILDLFFNQGHQGAIYQGLFTPNRECRSPDCDDLMGKTIRRPWRTAQIPSL